MKKIIFISVLFLITNTLFAIEAEEGDYLKKEKGFFGEISLFSLNFSKTNLFPDLKLEEKDKPFSSFSFPFHLGYQTEKFKAYLIVGFSSYSQGKDTATIKGNGILYGFHLEFTDLPSFEYIVSPGKSSEDKEKMGFSSLKFEIYPKRIALIFPKRLWFSRIEVFPGLGYELNKLTVKKSTDNIDGIMFMVSFDILVYPKVSFLGMASYNPRSTIRGMLGIKYFSPIK